MSETDVLTALNFIEDDEKIFFRFAEADLGPFDDNRLLEEAVLKRAAPLQGHVVLSYCLDEEHSTAWWQSWGGYEVEDEIFAYALLGLDAADTDAKAFPSLSDTEQIALIERLAERHGDNLSTADIQHGCRLWIDSLESEVRESLLADLRLWLNRT